MRYPVKQLGNQLGFLTCVLIASFLFSTVVAAHPLKVSVGFTTLVDAPGVTRVALGNGELAEVHALSETDEVLVIGLVPGSTDLRVWTDDGKQHRYSLTVGSSRVKIAEDELAALISDLEGIEMRALGNGDLLLFGQALRPRDAALAEALSERYSEIISEVTISKVVALPTINLNARIVEVRRSGLTEIGVDWADTFAGPEVGLISDWSTSSFFRPVLPDGFESTNGMMLPLDIGTQTYTGWGTRITSAIDLLAQDGVARLLAEPQVSVVSGQEARFVVGGELPVSFLDENGQPRIEYKDYGIILEIEPIADGADGLINTRIAVEVSSIDPSVSINGIPGFVSRKTNTHVSLLNGESFVVSGLLSNESSKDVSKVPGLGDIPILGELFKSRAFQNRETELLVMVRPTLVSAIDEVNKRRLEQFENLLTESRKAVQFSLFD
ncbi:MAG: pilus assembly protein N-terminal domain-containing protein [Marinobacter sp.]|uniref:type II and III secretion system protein family protein n=1 Tax=Marinobacter sp. TaxID=50741 RepID=UPI0034A073A6